VKALIETVLARSSKPVLTVPSTSTVREAAEFMASAGVRRLAVTEEGRVIGIFSAYHLVRILATGADPSSLRVSEAGLEVPAFLEPTATLLEASKVMASNNVTSVIVGSETNPLGILTTHDIVAALAMSALGNRPLSGALVKSYPYVDLGATLLEAAQAMISKGTSGVLVLDGDLLIGVLTVREVVARYAREGQEGLMTRVSELPVPPGAYIDEGATVSEAARVMEEEGVDVAPVLCGGRVCGAVDDITLTRWLASS
jgi:CBS domain-containing protein